MILRAGESAQCWALRNPFTGEVPLSLICASEHDVDALEREQRIRQPGSPYTERIEVVVSIAAT